MNPLFSNLGRALSLLLMVTLAPPAVAAEAPERAAVDRVLERIEGLAMNFGRLYEQRDKARPVANSEMRLQGVHQRLVSAVEALHAASRKADHRTARHILERFNDSALAFARNYLSPGEALIVRRGDAAALQHYRTTVSRMKGNLFSWNPDLDELMRDLLTVTRTVEKRMVPPPIARASAATL